MWPVVSLPSRGETLHGFWNPSFRNLSLQKLFSCLSFIEAQPCISRFLSGCRLGSGAGQLAIQGVTVGL
jgi:hypothetical protein